MRTGGLRGIEHQAGAIPRQHVQEEGVGPFHVHPHGQRVDYFDALYGVIEPPHAGFRFGVHEAVDAEFDGLGVHPVAVVEKGIVAKLERPRQGVVGQFPVRCHVPLELTVGRDVNQPTADIHGHPHHFVAGGGVEIEMGNSVAVGYPESAAAFRLSAKRQHRQQEGQHQKDNSLKEHVSIAHDVPTPSDPVHGPRGSSKERAGCRVVTMEDAPLYPIGGKLGKPKIFTGVEVKTNGEFQHGH